MTFIERAEPFLCNQTLAPEIFCGSMHHVGDAEPRAVCCYDGDAVRGFAARAASACILEGPLGSSPNRGRCVLPAVVFVYGASFGS